MQEHRVLELFFRLCFLSLSLHRIDVRLPATARQQKKLTHHTECPFVPTFLDQFVLKMPLRGQLGNQGSAFYVSLLPTSCLLAKRKMSLRNYAVLFLLCQL